MGREARDDVGECPIIGRGALLVGTRVGRAQHVLDEVRERTRVLDQAQSVGTRLVAEPALDRTSHQLGPGGEQGQRCPELVARVGDERPLQREGVRERADRRRRGTRPVVALLLGHDHPGEHHCQHDDHDSDKRRGGQPSRRAVRATRR